MVTILLIIYLYFYNYSTEGGLGSLDITRKLKVSGTRRKGHMAIRALGLTGTKGNATTLSKGIALGATNAKQGVSSTTTTTTRDLSGSLFFNRGGLLIFNVSITMGSLTAYFSCLVQDRGSHPSIPIYVSSNATTRLLSYKRGSTLIPTRTITRLLGGNRGSKFSLCIDMGRVLGLCGSGASSVYLPMVATNSRDSEADNVTVFSRDELTNILSNSRAINLLFLGSGIGSNCVRLRDRGCNGVNIQVVNTSSGAGTFTRNRAIRFGINIGLFFSVSRVRGNAGRSLSSTRLTRVNGRIRGTIQHSYRGTFCTYAGGEDSYLQINRGLTGCSPTTCRGVDSS